MAVPAKNKHFLVVNALGQSVHRQGPFESREAAIEWVEKNYAAYACWLIPAEYIGVPDRRPLNKDGVPAQEG